MRLISLFALLLMTFMIAGCESEEQKQAALEEQRATDALNACAEMGQTSRGFSGPSKRMEILKSYGWQPRQASVLEDIFKLSFAVDDSTGEMCSSGSSLWKRKCDCLDKVKALLSCEMGYIAVLNEAGQELVDEATKTVKQC